MCCCILVVKKCIHHHNYSIYIYIIYTVPVNRRRTLTFLLLLERLRRDRVCKISLFWGWAGCSDRSTSCPAPLQRLASRRKIDLNLILSGAQRRDASGTLLNVTRRIWWNSTHWLEWPRSLRTPQRSRNTAVTRPQNGRNTAQTDTVESRGKFVAASARISHRMGTENTPFQLFLL